MGLLSRQVEAGGECSVHRAGGSAWCLARRHVDWCHRGGLRCWRPPGAQEGAALAPTAACVGALRLGRWAKRELFVG